MNIIKLFKKMNKYKVVFCVKEANSYNIDSSIWIKANTKTVKYGNKNEYIIDLENPTFINGNVRNFWIDINNSKQIHFEELKEIQSVSSRINYMILTDTIIEQLARATTMPPKIKFDFVALIIGVIVGVLVGFIIKIFIPLPIGV